MNCSKEDNADLEEDFENDCMEQICLLVSFVTDSMFGTFDVESVTNDTSRQICSMQSFSKSSPSE